MSTTEKEFIGSKNITVMKREAGTEASLGGLGSKSY